MAAAWTVGIAVLAAPPTNAQQTAVGIPPLAGLLADLLPEGVPAPIVLLPPGQSPEHYDPRTRDLARLAGARVYFSMGLPFEVQLLRGVAATFPDVAVVELQPRPGMRAAELHAWLSPRRLRAMAERLALALPRHGADPAGTADRLATVLARIDALDAQARTAFSGLRDARVWVWHPAWAALAEDYGFGLISVEHEGREPTARQLEQQRREVADRGFGVLIVPAGHLGDGPRRLAERHGAGVLELNPLDGDWATMIEQTIRVLAAAAR